MGTVGTAPTESVLARRPVCGHHRRLQWWISRWALPLYHLHLLWLVGPRFLVLTHRGRRTGVLHRTCVLVIHEDRHTGELLVVAGDRHADWYRNTLAASPTEVAVGHRRFRPAMRLVGREELLRRLVTCRREHRLTARVQAAFFGWPWPATPAQLGALADRLGGVGLRPTRSEEV